MVMAESLYTGDTRGEVPDTEPGSRKPPEPELVSRPGAASEGSRGGSGPADAATAGFQAAKAARWGAQERPEP